MHCRITDDPSYDYSDYCEKKGYYKINESYEEYAEAEEERMGEGYSYPVRKNYTVWAGGHPYHQYRVSWKEACRLRKQARSEGFQDVKIDANFKVR